MVDVDGAFDEVVAQYEAAVPEYPAARFERLIAERATWADVVGLTERIAINGFLIYFKFPADPLMGLAGNKARCRVYLMGNHLLAERMYRHDPAVMLYAPLRTVITQMNGLTVRFAIDQPSAQFAQFGVPEIDAVGAELDRKLAALLTGLGWPVPAELAAGGVTRRG
ncbi:DUF302 domain-containing protein [Dactylosporangium sp. CS-047395]|uniref:DUF302 domain-containing protein n=1 Tax=Dactylosporangium sp. CS-047395 TaxID=3239936 RepID=UPI003D8E490F